MLQCCKSQRNAYMEVRCLWSVGVDRCSSNVLQVGIAQDAEVGFMGQQTQQDQIRILHPEVRTLHIMLSENASYDVICRPLQKNRQQHVFGITSVWQHLWQSWQRSTWQRQSGAGLWLAVTDQ